MAPVRDEHGLHLSDLLRRVKRSVMRDQGISERADQLIGPAVPSLVPLGKELLAAVFNLAGKPEQHMGQLVQDLPTRRSNRSQQQDT